MSAPKQITKKPARRERGGLPAALSVSKAGPARPAPLSPAAVSWRLTLPCVIVVVLAVVAAFLPALNNELVYWDDDDNLMENVYIRSLSAENLSWMASGQLLGVWQPLTWFITALEYRLFNGADLAAFSHGLHGVNIGLHAAASLLVFFVARRLIALGCGARAARSPAALNLGATVAALFFGLHPLRVEIVAWASGQPYILAFIPCVGAVWCYLKAHETGGWRWQGAALVCLALSLLCKSIAVPLVAVLLVLDVYPLRRMGGRVGWAWGRVGPALIEKIPYAVLALAVAYMTVRATSANKTYRPELLEIKLLISGFCVMFYPALTLAPVGIAPYYMKPIPFDTRDPVFMGALLAFGVVSLVLVLCRRRCPWLLAAWVCYVLIILPSVGIIKHGGQLAADRYTYLSCLSWAVLAGSGAVRLFSAGRAVRAAVALLLLGVLVGLGIKTASYCRTWKDSISLWSAMIHRNPRYHMGYYNLAKAYKRPAESALGRGPRGSQAGGGATEETIQHAREMFAEAERCYRKAIELYPTYPEANVDLGNMMKDGKAPGGVEGAMDRYETALRGRPGFHMAHWNIGILHERAGRYEEAARHLEAAAADAERAGERRRLPGLQADLARVRARIKP